MYAIDNLFPFLGAYLFSAFFRFVDDAIGLRHGKIEFPGDDRARRAAFVSLDDLAVAFVVFRDDGFNAVFFAQLMNRLTGNVELPADLRVGFQLFLKLDQFGFGNAGHSTRTPLSKKR